MMEYISVGSGVMTTDGCMRCCWPIDDCGVKS